jgi:HEPN domain-containing protein
LSESNPPEARSCLSVAMDYVEASCNGLGMDATVKQIIRIRSLLNVDPPGPLDLLSTPVKELISRIEDEFDSRAFFYMPMEKTKYYDDIHPLGDAVATRFPEMLEDSIEAAKSFACGRYTACVFHLMRAMERAAQSFAMKLGVSERAIHFKLKEWGRILGETKKKIDALPQRTRYSKKKREAYSEAWAFLDRVREAWRNPTMHPKETYTEEEARDIFGAVKAFMTRLAEII